MILVVDDNKGICESLAIMAKKAGYDVVTASDGVQAYEHIKSGECQCMLLDINMPRINGVELLMLMQADGLEVPTIVMAGFADFDEEEMKEFTNVVHFVNKPFEISEMLDVVKRYA